MRSTGRNDAGFTLVEMLVSLALLSLMTVYAVSALSSLRDFNRVADRVGAQAEVEAVVRHFHDTIGDVRPIFVMDESNSPQFLFSGSPNSLEFVSASNGARETGGLYLVRYSVDKEGTLMVERRLLREQKSGEPNMVKLLSGVRSLKFRYYISGSENAVDRWDRKDVLPSNVSVVVTFESDDDRKWPPFQLNLWAAK